MSTTEKHLYNLDELKDYKIRHNDPDIRGWTVKDSDNRTVGKVGNLLVNKDLEKVVYVDVEVDESIIDANHDPYSPHHDPTLHEFINEKGENHIIIPIGLIELNLENKYIYTDSLTYETFAETKRYRSGTAITRNYERHVLGSYNREDKTLWPDEIDKRREVRNHDLEKEEEREEIREEAAREERREAAREERLYEDRRSEEDIDEKIRREKENLKYKSHRDEPVDEPVEDDYDRRERLRDSDFHPSRTLDEDRNWERENDRKREREYDDDAYAARRRRRRERENEFYDRDEFRDRDYR